MAESKPAEEKMKPNPFNTLDLSLGQLLSGPHQSSTKEVTTDERNDSATIKKEKIINDFIFFLVQLAI